jgi:YVTN family beta-propeller protein
MNLRISGVLVIAACVGACLLGSGQSRAQNAYITNSGSNNVSVIDTASNRVTATIPVGIDPQGIAVSPNGSKVYVTNSGAPPSVAGNVSVIATATNTVIGSPIAVGNNPVTVAITADGSKVYVANFKSGTVSVIATASNTVTATIPVGIDPQGIAVSPDGSKVYVAHGTTGFGALLVIDTASHRVTATIPVGGLPGGVAVTPDGSNVYVTNTNFSHQQPDTVSVIAPATNTVTGTITVGEGPSGVAVTPDGSNVYVTNVFDNTVSVIDTASNTVTATISVGIHPQGIAVDGGKVYVANFGANFGPSVAGNVSVIDTASNTVIGSPITVGNAPVAFGVFIAVPAVQSAPLSGTRCNGVYDGTFLGSIEVSAGQDCVFITGGQVAGDVSVVGGHFVLNGATVVGRLKVGGGGTFTLGPAATVGADLIIQDLAPRSASNSVCGTTIGGKMTFKNNATAVQIGSAYPLFCAGNKIGTSFDATGNSSSVLIFNNSIGADATGADNTGPLDVVDNKVAGTLTCMGNSMLIMGGGNTARQSTGQCN